MVSESVKNEEARRLTEDILEAILAISALDFSKTVDVGFEDSGFNAVASGLNMLGEELQRSVVSVDYVNNILESMNDSLLVVNTSGNVATINSFCSNLLGYKKDDINDKAANILFGPTSYQKIEAILSGEQQESLRAIDVNFKTASGQDIPMQVNASIIQDKNGVNTGVLLVGRDMRETISLIARAERSADAERRRALELTQAHEELEKTHEQLTSFNASLQSEIVQRNRAEEELKEAKDRLEQQVLERTKELRQANNHLNKEIEVRKRAERDLRAREEKFRNIFETASVGILEVDFTKLLSIFAALPKKTKSNLAKELAQDEMLSDELLKAVNVLDVNKATLEMFAAEDMKIFVSRLKEVFFEKSAEWAKAGVEAVAANSKYFETTCSLKNLNGKVLEVLVQVRLYPSINERVGGLVTIIDLSELRFLQAQLRQSQKMEAVGRIAGGISHDFNNLLTVILSYGQMVLEDLDESSELRSKIEPMVECSEKAAALTKQLLAFSRRQVIEPKIIDLNKLIGNLEKMLIRVLGEDIELVGEKAPGLGKIKCDPSQIEQIIMNLAVNARDAMSHGGKLIIETKNVNLDADYVKDKDDLEPGQYALLAVSDTGEGMPPDVRARIFEPFFTTKGVGKGTGLGLSTVYGIVRQSKGHLDVYSELGHGTVFKIYLPLVSEVSASDDKQKEVDKKLLEGSDTILVVEDEDSVRMVACAVLKKSGYTVLQANDPLVAIDLISNHKGKIDLLLSDVIMPNMRGPQMAEKICEIRPGLKVLFMSGYTDNAINQNGILDKGKAFLQKPFTPDSLLTRVKNVLQDDTANLDN